MSTGRLVIGGLLAAVLAFVALVAAMLRAPLSTRQHLFVSAFGDTEYAPGYSERAFEQLLLGATRADVITALGPPFGEHSVQPVHFVLYADQPADDFAETGSLRGIERYTCLLFDSEGKFESMFAQISLRTGLGSWTTQLDTDGTGANPLRVDARQIETWKNAGATPAEIQARFGPPTATHRNDTVRWMQYSRSPSDGDYQRRWIGLDRDDRVCFKRAEAYCD